MSNLSHFDDAGRPRMVDVGNKPETLRMARASALVAMRRETADLIRGGGIGKGDVLAVARLAGIAGAKRTSDLIPLCHPVRLTQVEIDFQWLEADRLRIEAQASAMDRTGVEMEALTAVATAALTVYDMCKAVDRGMSVQNIELEEKLGGKSGHYLRRDQPA